MARKDKIAGMNSNSSSSRYAKFWTLRADVDFLNHGSFGACPIAVQEHQIRIRAEMEAEPVQFLWRRYEERLDPARRQLAQFLHARREDVAFVQNATAGVNAFIRSQELRRGDELLTTSLDYNACRNVLTEAARRQGATVVLAPAPFPVDSSDQIVDAILAKVTPRTRLALIDHVTSDTGMVLPVAKIIAELRELGVETLVDGAHAPGMLQLNLEALNPAAYTGNLHKWVCAPKGAAFLWVRPDLQDSIQPPSISHGNNRPRQDHTPFQDRFDWTGTFDPSAWFSVGEALHFMAGLLPGGWAELRRTNRALALAARKLLCAKLRVPPPCPESMVGSLATIPLPERYQNRPRKLVGKLEKDQVRLYDDYGIEVPFSRIGAPERRYFRISAQIYNSIEQYERLCKVLNEMPVA